MLLRIMFLLLFLAASSVLIYAASILTTRDTLNGLVYYHETIYRNPTKAAINFDDWKRRSDSSLWAMDSMLDQDWRLSLAYPGFRYDLKMMMSRFSALGKEYSRLVREMDAMFAENELLRRGWEEVALPNMRRGVDEQNISIGQVTDSLFALMQNFNESKEVLVRYREFSESQEKLRVDLDALLERYRKELGPMDAQVQSLLDNYLGGR